MLFLKLIFPTFTFLFAPFLLLFVTAERRYDRGGEISVSLLLSPLLNKDSYVKVFALYQVFFSFCLHKSIRKTGLQTKSSFVLMRKGKQRNSRHAGSVSRSDPKKINLKLNYPLRTQTRNNNSEFERVHNNGFSSI